MVKDWSYVAAFKRKDLPSLQEMAAHIRKTHDTDMIQDINQRFEDNASILKNGIKIQDVTKTDDVIVTVGLSQCIDIILGFSSTRWRYMGAGSPATATPSISDTALASEQGRVDMSINGWREPEGMKLFFGAIGGETFGEPWTLVLTECGVFNNPTGPTMLNHENFGANQLNRSGSGVMLNNVFIISTVIEFCPIA